MVPISHKKREQINFDFLRLQSIVELVATHSPQLMTPLVPRQTETTYLQSTGSGCKNMNIQNDQLSYIRIPFVPSVMGHSNHPRDISLLSLAVPSPQETYFQPKQFFQLLKLHMYCHPSLEELQNVLYFQIVEGKLLYKHVPTQLLNAWNSTSSTTKLESGSIKQVHTTFKVVFFKKCGQYEGENSFTFMYGKTSSHPDACWLADTKISGSATPPSNL